MQYVDKDERLLFNYPSLVKMRLNMHVHNTCHIVNLHNIYLQMDSISTCSQIIDFIHYTKYFAYFLSPEIFESLIYLLLIIS